MTSPTLSLATIHMLSANNLAKEGGLPASTVIAGHAMSLTCY